MPLESLTLSSLIRISEAARRLEVSAQTVRNYTDQKRIRCYRSVDGERLYHPSEVDEFKRNRDAEREAIASIRQKFRTDGGAYELAMVV